MGKYTNKKVNNTPKAKKLKKELEKLGHKNVEVWYETIRSGSEMSGYEGGWNFCSGNDSIKRVYSPEGISPTLTTMVGGNRQPKIEVMGNYSPSGHDASRIVNSNGLAPTVKENHGTVTATNVGSTVRKLVPLECWRLMSFDDKDFYKAQSTGNSNSQLYKQARKLNCSKGFRKNIFKFIKGELNGSQRKN